MKIRKLNRLLILLLATICFDLCRLDAATHSTPQRVVSLLPSATEIIQILGESDKLVGISIHDRLPPTEDRKIVGSFFNPIIAAIRSVQPDTIIISPRHQNIAKEFASRSHIVTVEINSIDELYKTIRLLGNLFHKDSEAEKLISEIKTEISLVQQKLSKIPNRRPVRVMRFMGRQDSETVMAPGDDSFQNDLIRLSGGTPPSFGKNGAVIPVSLAEWQRFDPEVIYGCGEDRQVAEKFFSLLGWKDVSAVKNGRIFYFPCDLTCRISPHSGKFIQWLASVIFEDAFSNPALLATQEGIEARKPIPVHLPFVKSAEVVTSRILDFQNKTLLIHLTEPMDVLSTLEGPRTAQFVVGNHSSPPPLWGVSHRLGLDGWRSHIEKVLGISQKEASLLFTGANMDNMSLQVRTHGDLVVYALVTAGAESNALRASRDTGSWEEPGTINIILMTNRKLSPRAMARAVITATEAKTAALQDLDIRSSYTGLKWQATGTGTDEIIVVSGKGKPADNSGGHARLGELIARAVYDGVKDALARQNSFHKDRSIFRRFQERRLELYSLIPNKLRSTLLPKVEEVLLDPRYATFMEIAFLLSDAEQQGLIEDLSPFRSLAFSISREIAQKYGRKKEVKKWDNLVTSEDVPEPIATALNAIMNGLK
ncbi:MAG: adenosylcobinamide amidohydrolase [Thermodesulforhabdaceae bacterium]